MGRPRKFSEVAELIARRIEREELSAGASLPGQREFAKEFSVSRACVQKSIDLLAEKGLVEKRPGLGVFIAGKSAVCKKLKNLSLIIPDYVTTTISTKDNFGLEIMWGIEQQARQRGANLMLRKVSLEKEAEKLTSIVRQMNPDGIIAFHHIPDFWLETMSRIGVRTVVVGRKTSVPEIGAVMPNYFDYFAQMFEQMYLCGVRKICVICQGNRVETGDIASAMEYARRSTAFERFELLDFSLGRACFDPYESPSYVDEIVGRMADEDNFPDVFVCDYDWTALHVMNSLKRRQIRVPEKVGVTGATGLLMTDGLELTTLAIDSSSIGFAAVDLLAGMLERGEAPQILRIPLHYVEKKTFRGISGI